VINALENIRTSIDLLSVAQSPNADSAKLLDRARHENEDAILVLAGGGLHSEAVLLLQSSASWIEKALAATDKHLRDQHAQSAAADQVSARENMVGM